MLLAAEGANVVVNDPGVNSDGTGHDNGPAEQVVAEIKAAGGNAVANADTVATFEGGENMVRQCVDAFGRIDILMNVAGILRDRMIFNMNEEEWDAVIAVHLKGHFNTIQPASILMRQQRYGRIVNFSSISGLRGISGQSNYGAAKAAIAGLTRVVARDLGKYGVTCNAISPGAATRLTATIPDSARQLRAATQAQPTAPPPVQVVAGDAGARRADDGLAVHRRRLERKRQDLLRRRRHSLSGPRGDADPVDQQGRQVDAGRAGLDRPRPAATRDHEPGATAT